ncbi:hypothetical protein HN803_05835 [candidate division WWE3 bacterium]|jgi:hypothetical protein|nr:hypothetical protein [candidate division WWE3 bacterium]MBT7350275.1 hypothetical protein [candidate division WWE3 bacterium]
MSLINNLITRIFDFVFPLAVIIGFVRIVLAGYAMMTSQGDPAKVGEAKENLTAAITGMLFILFSIAILRIIVVNLITDGTTPF